MFGWKHLLLKHWINHIVLLFSCRVRQFKLEQVVIIVVITAAWVTPHSQFILSMDQEVWRGERGGFYLHFIFITIAHKKSPLLESIKHWNSILSSPAPLIWSVLHRLRSLSELTILTWKKISNKDICDPISHAGPHSSEAPLVFIVMEMMLFANWLLHPPQATFPTTISLTRRVSPLIWIPSILWPPCCLCTYEGFKGNTIQDARVSQNMWKFS